MVGPGLKKLAEERSLTIAEGIAYGTVGGYTVTLSEGMGVKSVSVSADLSDDAVWERTASALSDPQKQKEYRLQQLTRGRTSIAAVLTDTVGTIGRLKDCLDWLTETLTRCGAPGAAVCPVCHQPISSGNSGYLEIGGIAHLMHDACADSIGRQAQARTETVEAEEKHYLRGTVGALLGSVVGAIPWIIVYLLGWFVGWLGFLIGAASAKGYQLLGGKPGKAKFWIILLCSLFGVVFGNFMAQAFSLFPLISDGTLNFAYWQTPALVIDLLVIDAEFRSGMIADLGLGVLFAALGCWGVLKQVRQEHKAQAVQTKRLP